MTKRKRNKEEANASDDLEVKRKRVDKFLQRGTAKIARHLEAAKASERPKTDDSSRIAAEAVATKVPNTK